MERADGHRYYEGLAVAHVLGGLDDTEGQVFRAHLLECVDCRARVGELRAIAHDLADVERDERRMRAAQAIDTKRREGDDSDDDGEDPPEATRLSRVTVIVGFVLLIGLSLWNFTLRGALSQEQQYGESLQEAGVLQQEGDPWTVERAVPPLEGSIIAGGEAFVAIISNLDPNQIYGLYVLDDNGGVVYKAAPFIQEADGQHYALHRTKEMVNATKVVLTNPPEGEGDPAALPGESPGGDYVFVARR